MDKKTVLVSIAIFLKDINSNGFKFWVQVRNEEGPLFGKLEFPGGKIESGESPLDAVKREVFEEVNGLDIAAHMFKSFMICPYSSETKNIYLNVFISAFDQMPKDCGQWLTLDYLQKSAPFKGQIPPINHVIIDELAVYLEKFFKDTQQGIELLEYLWTT